MAKKKKKAETETPKLSLVEATALNKLSEKIVDQLKKQDKLEPGSHAFDFSVDVSGNLARGNSTKVTPQFKIADYLKPLLLLYAAKMEDPVTWLQSILGEKGTLPIVVQLGPKQALKSVDFELEAVWDSAVNRAKEQFQEQAEQVDRAGNTVVAGTLTKTC